jgi:hypothetical protein
LFKQINFNLNLLTKIQSKVKYKIKTLSILT